MPDVEGEKEDRFREHLEDFYFVFSARLYGQLQYYGDIILILVFMRSFWTHHVLWLTS